MELIPLELSLYLDNDMKVLNDLYVRNMILVSGWESYIAGSLYVRRRDLQYKLYRAILFNLSRSRKRIVSNVILVYTMVRYLYPHRKVGMFLSKKNVIELYYLDYNWNNDIPEGYTNIYNIEDLMRSIALYGAIYNGLIPVWKYEDIVEKVPELKDRIRDMTSIHMGVMTISHEIVDELQLDAGIEVWMDVSISLIRDYNVYDRIMKDIPPYSSIRRKRRYTYGNDVDFLFR